MACMLISYVRLKCALGPVSQLSSASDLWTTAIRMLIWSKPPIVLHPMHSVHAQVHKKLEACTLRNVWDAWFALEGLTLFLMEEGEWTDVLTLPRDPAGLELLALVVACIC